MKHIRLLPIVILVAVLSFSVRLSHVFVDAQEVYVTVQQASAAEPDKEDTQDASEDDVLHDSAAEASDDGDEEASQAKVSDELKEELPVWRDSVEQDFVFESTRDDYVQYLEVRRKALDERQQELQAREALLKAAKQEMDRKYVELNQIRKQLEGLLSEQQDQQQEQIQSLVRIYEGMKAKEAAAIFNSLDLDILLSVMSNMSDRKAAAIIAKMNPERAKTLTVMLAEKKSLPTL